MAFKQFMYVVKERAELHTRAICFRRQSNDMFRKLPAGGVEHATCWETDRNKWPITFQHEMLGFSANNGDYKDA
ncbi:hypothetical protein EVAR_102889_1 [Eumeta japonica]|uniref:Uncharacterized protein n=1 Tax=Eumeta variegata TaxID=151549 RepID=A0A4C1UP64_EUMVA|nr:hypothetical protein EVAR_102889_1 [Eumeta japonica]